MTNKQKEIFGKFTLPTAVFIDWTQEMTDDMIGYMKDLLTDLTPLLIPIIAIGVGLIIVGVIIRAIRGN